MRRYIESALRLRIRLIICAILVFGVSFSALYFSKGGYSSAATVWVEKPLFLDVGQINFSQYISPAKNQANILYERLRTRQFTLEIARRAGLPMNTGAAEDRAVADLQKNISVDDIGNNLVKLAYTSSKPQYTEPVVSQTIQVFLDTMFNSIATQSQSALVVYRDQLSTYQKRLDSATQALNDYIKANPNALASDAAIQDPTLNQLQQAVTTERESVDTVQAKIDQVLSQSTARKQSNNDFFNVIDAPTAAEPYQVTSKDLLRNGGIAIALTLLALIAIILVGTWTDQAIYTLNDISSIALNAEDGDAPELLVGLVPYVPMLAAIRRKDIKQSRPGGGGRRRGKSEPSVTVVTGTDIIPRTTSSNGDGPSKRPPDALPDIAASASVRR